MPHFKDPVGNLHFLEDSKFINLLPKGSIQITDLAVEKLRAKLTPSTNERVIAQITALEASVTPRRFREAVLGDNGWLANLESQIEILRSKMS